MTEPPLRYNEFHSILVSLFISAIVGVAAGLASIDDAGRRELIGLAAAAQIGIIPVWVGVCFVFPIPATLGSDAVTNRLASLGLNIAAIILASLVVLVLSKVADRNLSRLKA